MKSKLVIQCIGKPIWAEGWLKVSKKRRKKNDSLLGSGGGLKACSKWQIVHKGGKGASQVSHDYHRAVWTPS